MAVAKKTSGSGRAAGGMGSQKVTTDHKSSGNRKNRGKKNSGNRSKSAAAQRRNKVKAVHEYEDHQAFEAGITLFVIGIVGVLLYISYFGLAGKVGTVIGGVFFGVFGWFAWFLPVIAMIGYIFYLVNQGDRRVMRRIFSCGGTVLCLMGLSDLIFGKTIISEYYISNHVFHKEYFDCMYLTCHDVMSRGKFNGGLIGRAVGGAFSSVIGKAGAIIVLFVLLLLFLYIFYGVEMMGMIRRRNARQQQIAEIREQLTDGDGYEEPSYRVFHSPFQSAGKSGKGLKPAPELEKAPRVQSFDLQKLNEHLDYMEKGTDRQGDQEQKDPISEEKKKINRKEALKGADSTIVEIKGGKNETAVERDRGSEESKNEDVQRNIELDIPIYRNELQEKFGGKKSEKKPEKPVQVIHEPGGFAQESAFTAFENTKEYRQWEDTAEEKEIPAGQEQHGIDEQNNIAEHQNSAAQQNIAGHQNVSEQQSTAGHQNGSEQQSAAEQQNVSERQSIVEVINEYVETDDDMDALEKVGAEETAKMSSVSEPSQNVTSGMPMASFAPKEEVTDVTPLSQKTAQNQSNGSPSVIPFPGSGEMQSEAMQNVAEQMSVHESVQAEKIGDGSAGQTENGRMEGQAVRENPDVPQEMPKPEKPYVFPPIDLLEKPKKENSGMSDSKLRKTAAKLQNTLKSFNVNVQVGAVTCGPTVTRYEILPEQGVRVNKITNLADDLKLSLAAPSIRIEAPIPGKAAVGIEVPNEESSAVSFRELLEGDTFSKAKSPLTFAVGKDIAGKIIMADIGKMPHVLIAGATGSGKSVCINTLIMSILYKADPNDVKLIMIDPKVVELSVYNGIPHLFCPVVTDPKEAAAALNWAVREMMDRYNKFKELGVRNISGYNEKIKTVEDAASAGYEKMSYLVVIVDEFADLMMVASKEVEDAVCRLAQLARAAGIHLVLATQRPSVNVITGVIKANIPSRVAFSVSSAIDSRTILDKGGAEKLLGKGDMLFFPSGYTEPVRVQGAFVSDKEVSDVVDFLCESNDTPEYNHAVTEIVEEVQDEAPPAEKKTASDRDEYFEDAGRFVIESDRAAAGQLQRHFSIGFNRAGRIIDQLHKAGVVGPAEGTKPRKVLMTVEEFEIMLSGGSVSSDGMESAMQETAAAGEENYVSGSID